MHGDLEGAHRPTAVRPPCTPAVKAFDKGLHGLDRCLNRPGTLRDRSANQHLPSQEGDHLQRAAPHRGRLGVFRL